MTLRMAYTTAHSRCDILTLVVQGMSPLAWIGAFVAGHFPWLAVSDKGSMLPASTKSKGFIRRRKNHTHFFSVIKLKA